MGSFRVIKQEDGRLSPGLIGKEKTPTAGSRHPNNISSSTTRKAIIQSLLHCHERLDEGMLMGSGTGEDRLLMDGKSLLRGEEGKGKVSRCTELNFKAPAASGGMF